MQRNFLRGLLICLIPCLASVYLIVAALYKWDSGAGGIVAREGAGKFKLGIDLAGGTILVYEINTERTRQLELAKQASGGQQAQETTGDGGLKPEDMVKLAAQIKRRIDPADLKNVTVRPLGNKRIEIILPTGGAGQGDRSNLTAEEIEEVKSLVSQMGVLEFRILANKADDEAGVRAAEALLDNPDPATLSQMKEKAVQGIAPPGPPDSFGVWVNEDEATRQEYMRAYPDKLIDGKPAVKYFWVEMSAEERASPSLQLSNEFENKSPLWITLAGKRGKTHLIEHAAGDEDTRRMTSMLVFSRDVDPKSPGALKEVEKVRLAALTGKTPDDDKREIDGGLRAKLEAMVKDKTDDQIYAAMLADPEVSKLVNAKKFEYFVLTRVSDVDTVRIEGDISLTAAADVDQKTFKPSVSFTFNGAGARAFGRMTSRNRPDRNANGNIRSLAIVLDDKVVSAPSLNAVITSRGQITGNFDTKSVNRLVNFLRNGALNAQLREKPVSENTIGPTLGEDTIRKGTSAVGLAFAAVLVFMLIYYRFAGFVACVALLANLLLTVGFMVAVNAAFTLSGMAGIVLMLGMAVDANVLIYERLREERNKGANIATALRNGYDRAFLTIIDTHLTSIFTAIVLYTFGNDNLKGFSVALTVGLVISLFTSLYMTRLMFDFWFHKKWLTNLRMMRLFERPNFNPMKYRYYMFALTATLTIAGLGLFLYRGENALNVDFRGGTVYGGRLKDGEERSLTTVGDKPGYRDLLSEDRQKERLKVSSAVWQNPPANKEAIGTQGTYTYEITYAQDGAKAIVNLTEKPGGASTDEAVMAQDVVDRASKLPDVSVEQMFLTGDPTFTDRKSRYFTLRTTERQPDIVRASIDRLFRDKNNESIIASTKMTIPAAVAGPLVELTFEYPASRNSVESQLMDQFRAASADDGANTFKLEPDKTTEVSGRYTRMVLNVSMNTKMAALGGPDPATAAVDRGTLTQILQKTKMSFESRPEPLRLEVFDSQLATETRSKALVAILVSWLAIILYLWFRFGNWTFGLAAVLCLVHDLCFTLGMIAAAHYIHETPLGPLLEIEDFKIDLVAVAALLTLVGYSVNEIIVNFARIREVRGKNPSLTPQMINDSVNQTLSRTILTSMTVFLVSSVLYIFGGEGVHLFAFVMVIGVLISTYSSIFIASPLLMYLGEGQHVGTESAAEEAPKDEQEEEVVEG